MAANSIGPSTTQTSYLTPLDSRVRFVSLLSAGDAVPGSLKADGTPNLFVGVPDGAGAYDNGDGTFTVLLNHEIGATQGAVRVHGSVGAFVDRMVIDKQTLAVRSISDLGTSVFGYDPTTASYVQGTTAFNRLCSADLPVASAFFDAATGLGTQARIYMNGEEAGAEGRAYAWIATGAESGRVYELPRLGKFSWENSVTSPTAGSKTVVIGQDDGGGGQLYLYAGDKQATGTEIDKAGLTNGKLYGIKVPTMPQETNETTIGPAGIPFILQEQGPNGDVSGFTGAQLQDESVAEGVTGFLRPEDGAWDPSNPNRYYFATTNSATGPSRLWALDFTDAQRPELGGSLKIILAGFEGQVMLDNLTVTADGKVILQEDVGNNARLGKIFEYDPATGALNQLAEHDAARFSGLTPPFNQDEESSGVIDVSDILGSPGTQAFLLDVQAHYTFPGTEVIQGGQLQVMYVDRSIQGTAANETLTGSAIDDLILGGAGDDRINGGTGTNILNGGTGTDTAVFGFTLADASYSAAPGVATISVPGTTSMVSGFERYQFADGTVIQDLDRPLVDDLFYAFNDKDVFAAKVDADVHYGQIGFSEGRDPNAFFSTTGYLAANSDVRAAGLNPLAQYANTGFKQGRDPGANFDNELYLRNNPDVQASGMNPLAHYLAFGQNEGRQTYATIGKSADITAGQGFDAEFYLLANPDVASASFSTTDSFAFAQQHFNQNGFQEGRNPNAFFDVAGYLQAYPDVLAAGVNPLTHYNRFGAAEGRDPSGAFDTSMYLAANPDVQAAGVNPLQHYIEFGALEGRSAFGDGRFG